MIDTQDIAVTEALPRRRIPVGAELQPGGGVHFRVWAPNRRQVRVVLESGPGAPGTLELEPEGEGYFSGHSTEAAEGSRYRIGLDEEHLLLPDPASRFQPEGPHGPSEVIDPEAYRWRDADWKGLPLKGQVIYELHVGTFTPEGTFAAAAARLGELAETGITVIELMPVADFVGRFGWGYDGVDLFAPSRLYGRPDDLRRFVDTAHGLGMAVILDVVYNHFGPDGAYFKFFSEAYFTDKYDNEWGDALNFDGDGAGPVREFFVANAGYWIEEFHIDGLRLDATQDIKDASEEHVLGAISRRVQEAAKGRKTILVAENEPQHVRLVRPPEQGGYGLNGLWNDDFHHSAMVALTGRNPAYYEDHLGAPQEFISAAKWGDLFQGQHYRHQSKPRGTAGLDLPPETFVTYLQNHDQVANSARGQRVHELTSPGRLRAMTAVLLLGPGTPMLFQGQEWAASSPFLYFADHKKELTEAIKKGRGEFLSQFPCIAADMLPHLADPGNPATFERCRLDWSERERHSEWLALHRDLLRLRREDAAFRVQEPRGLDGAVLGPEAFVLRFFAGYTDDRLLLVNLGRDLRLEAAPEPLLAPPAGKGWEIAWSSEDPRYGGNGTAPLPPDGWFLPGQSALVLRPV